MLNNENLFIQTKDEIEKLWSNNKKLSNFVKWPKNLALKEKTTHKINVTEKLSIWKSSGDHQIDKIHNLISNLAPNVNWNNGYSEDQTSKEFLDKYGFFELIGPTGHFVTTDMALYVNYLDKNSYYPWHNHEAEELYFIVSGEAKFESESEKPKILKSTDTRFHKSYEAHRITTTNKNILSFVIWKNKYENVSKILD
ncbi:dimethylsulfonioproprionate lyase family protein [bacterium]|jgi:mannose-6-phosphate isomerase-like protein (cupin superfamily)|nr:dimethylsulfonioproprionate lyase family protein [bacterium]